MSKLKIALLVVTSICLVLILTTLVAHAAFNHKVKKEVTTFFEEVETSAKIITVEDLASLPTNVQKWLAYTGIIGRESITSVRLNQRAEMRLSKDGTWLPVKAEQYFTTQNPGFVWKAKIDAAPLVHIVGKDKYAAGRGSMVIKPLSLFSIVDAAGEEIDQGAMLRYLAEIVWFPTAALEDYIRWEAIDDHQAIATMTYGDVTASGIFTFNDKGEVILFEAERYGEFDGEFRLELWSIPLRDYHAFDGIRVPTKGDVTWKFETGDYNWFNFELIDIEYNNPVSY